MTELVERLFQTHPVEDLTLMTRRILPRLMAVCVGAFATALVLNQPVAAESESSVTELLFGNEINVSPDRYDRDGYHAEAPARHGRSGKEIVSFSNQFAAGQIIVSFADRRLYYIERRGRALSYPIATPRPQDRWQGTMRISNKKVNPTWTPTAQMRRENPKLPDYVPGGHPRNPLGYRALYLGSSLYRIHGTDAPWSIGRSISKGCIRMYNADVEDLYRRVRVGAKVTVDWKRYSGSSS